MIEIRIHGRGGQGNVVAAYLLAGAAFEAGRYCQAFPAFGAERRGAPVQAYVRIDEKPILRRDAVRTPGFLIVQDAALLHETRLTAGLAKGGGILVNSDRDAADLKMEPQGDFLTIPATRLAVEHLGRPVPNVALLAALLTLTELLPIDALSRALANRFSGDILSRNENLAAAAARNVTPGLWREKTHAPGA
jgi:pyruvate ferredoxin oxidoreductase gamma subunit